MPIPAEVAAQGETAVRRFQDEHRLAYQPDAPVNWCPALGTVLANEEVIDGKSERGGHPVQRIPLRQWMLRITAYADRLESGPGRARLVGEHQDAAAQLDRPQHRRGGRFLHRPDEPITRAGNATASSPAVPVDPRDDVLRIYTTRPDTLFGATYMVIAPEHPFVERLTTAQQQAAVRAYCEAAARKSDLDRTDLAKDKTGVFTGSYAINPVNGQAIPIWVADYVLISYGTGAIMAVPAHDTRDFEFAQQFAAADRRRRRSRARPPTSIAKPSWPAAKCSPATAPPSTPAQYDGLPTAEFKQQITADLTAQGLGRAAVNYKLRDWLFSRQRFWGEPFPILHELDDRGEPTGLLRAVPDSRAAGRSAAAGRLSSRTAGPSRRWRRRPTTWLYPVIDGRRYQRETNTMPQWAGSCWYYLRFLDPDNDQALVDPQMEKAWMPVDLYVGGAEHAVLHLLYARFWHKVLYDRGYVSHARAVPETGQPGDDPGRDGVHRLPGPRTATGSAPRTCRPMSRGGSSAAVMARPVQPVRIEADQVEKHGDVFVLTSRSEPSGRQSGPTRCPRAAATWSTPTRSSASTAPIRCGCTRCSWARWRPPSPGAWRA